MGLTNNLPLAILTMFRELQQDSQGTALSICIQSHGSEWRGRTVQNRNGHQYGRPTESETSWFRTTKWPALRNCAAGKGEKHEQNIKLYNRHRTLGLVQMAIMSAIENAPAAAYGTAIAKRVSDMTGREVADAQVFVALRRLEMGGLVTDVPEVSQSKPSKRSRGRPRKFYELTATGKVA